MARRFLRWVREKQWRLTCERCGHVWEVIGEPPEACAKCRSKYWDHPPGTLKRGRPRKIDT